MIDIGGVEPREQFGPATPASPLAEGGPDHEAQEVLALLAGLQYVPQAEIMLGEDTLDLLAADVAQLAQTKTEGSRLLTAARSDGGMVTLSREAAIAERPDALGKQAEAGQAEPLFLEERTRVEEIQSRYQAFEVSMMQDVPHQNNNRQMEAERVPAELAMGADGTSDDKPALSGGSAIFTPVDSLHGDFQGLSVLDEEVEQAGGSLVAAEPSQMTTSRVLRAAAAVAFLLYTSRTARSADVKEPEQGSGVPLGSREE